MRKIVANVLPASSVGMGTSTEPEHITKAYDENYDPSYGAVGRGQVIIGQHSFKRLREENNSRRRHAARHEEDS